MATNGFRRLHLDQMDRAVRETLRTSGAKEVSLIGWGIGASGRQSRAARPTEAQPAQPVTAATTRPPDASPNRTRSFASPTSSPPTPRGTSPARPGASTAVLPSGLRHRSALAKSGVALLQGGVELGFRDLEGPGILPANSPSAHCCSSAMIGGSVGGCRWSFQQPPAATDQDMDHGGSPEPGTQQCVHYLRRPAVRSTSPRRRPPPRNDHRSPRRKPQQPRSTLPCKGATPSKVS